MTKQTLRRAAKTNARKISLLAIAGIFAILTIGLVLGEMTSGLMQQRANAYSDVAPDSSYADAIEEISLLGIVRGYENGLYGPDDPITRGQMAIILSRLRQKELRNLRAQVEELRAALSLGTCGDGTVQTGEECDDGNTLSKDGCSAECLNEIIRSDCAGGHRIGDSYTAPDGCNTCLCTENGPVCTEIHCTAPEEDLPEEPEESETVPVISNAAPICGNGICEIRENILPPDRRFHCPRDCTGEEYQLQCEDLTEEFLAIDENERSCISNADCVKLEQSCPFITCGEAVNKSNYPKLSLKLDTLMDTCRREGLIRACVTCAYSVAVCEAGQCVLKQVNR